jgi:hypothetical protein
VKGAIMRSRAMRRVAGEGAPTDEFGDHAAVEVA